MSRCRLELSNDLQNAFGFTWEAHVYDGLTELLLAHTACVVVVLASESYNWAGAFHTLAFSSFFDKQIVFHKPR